MWRSQSQLELAVVEYIAWLDTARLHSSLGNRTPAEHEASYHTAVGSLSDTPSIPDRLERFNGPGYDPFGVVSDRRA